MIISTAEGWDAALREMSGGAGGTVSNPSIYTLNIQGTVSVPGVSAASVAGNYKRVRLTGSGTLSLDSDGSVFRTGSARTLSINGPTLKGKTANSFEVVYVASGGTVELRMRRERPTPYQGM